MRFWKRCTQKSRLERNVLSERGRGSETRSEQDRWATDGGRRLRDGGRLAAVVGERVKGDWRRESGRSAGGGGGVGERRMAGDEQ